MSGKPNASTELTAKVSEWYALKGQLGVLTDREKALRQEIFNEGFPTAGEKGSQRIGLSHGKELRGEVKTNYTVDKTAMADARPQLPADVFDRVIRWKPEVSATELARVTDKDQARLFADFITSKPGLPTIEIVDESKRK